MKQNTADTHAVNNIGAPESTREHEMHAEQTGCKKRFLCALFPCGLLCFIYLFFGPLSLIHENASLLHISILQSTPYYIAAFILGCACLAAVLALLRGPLYDGALRVVFWLGIASYIQRYMLNPDFGLLDGRVMQWQEYAGTALLNIAIWGALLLAVCVVALLLPKQWKKIVCVVSAIVVLMQCAALALFYKDSIWTASKAQDYHLSTKDIAQISSRENVFIFILDACSNAAIEKLLSEYPDALDGLTDFTRYHNCSPSFSNTCPELIVTLTGNTSLDPTKSMEDFEKASWSSPESVGFYELLAENKYKVNMYTKEGYLSRKYENISDKFSNAAVLESPWRIQPAQLFEKMTALTLWSYVPTGFKACFYTTTEDFTDIAVIKDLEKWENDGRLLSEKIYEDGIAATDDNIFALYHLLGAHPGYVMDENGKVLSEGNTSVERQLKGSLLIIEEFIQRLKKEGSYDSSTIIIMGDHGDYRYQGAPLDAGLTYSAALFVKRRGETHEAMPVSNAPVSHLELLPTIAADIDPNHQIDFGRTLNDIGENEIRKRRLYYWVDTGPTNNHIYDSLYVYDFVCDINKFTDVSNPDEVLTLYDSYY